MTQELNIQNLNFEFSKCAMSNGMDRNEQDQRFGQYIHNNFNFSTEEIKDNDGFYTERADEFYNLIYKTLI